jgi:acyl carrier protein
MDNHRNGTGLNRAAVAEMIMSSLQEVLTMDNGGASVAVAISEDTPLIGRAAVLDSMGLVNLIVEVEQRLEEEFDMAVVLADERAMSQRNSPFRSVQSLADYIYGLVEA